MQKKCFDDSSFFRKKTTNYFIRGNCFRRELKHFKCNYMFCASFLIRYCRIVNINNCTFITLE